MSRSHIQTLYAKIQANRLNQKSFRKKVSDDINYLSWAVVVLSLCFAASMIIGANR